MQSSIKSDKDTFTPFLKEIESTIDCLLIGEDHVNSSALIGLAHALDKTPINRKIMVFTEDLNRVQNNEGRDQAYTVETLNKNMHDGEKDKEAIVFLIKNGVEVYGVESAITNPIPFFQAMNKMDLYQQAQTNMPYIFKKPVIANYILDSYNDENISFESFEYIIISSYGYSNERITIVNEEFANQICLLSEENKNALCVFTGGAAHIPAAVEKNTTLEIDEGMLHRLQNNGLNTAACFVNDINANSEEIQEGTDNVREVGYKPYDEHLNFAVIPNRFQIPSAYHLSQADTQEIKNESKPKTNIKVFLGNVWEKINRKKSSNDLDFPEDKNKKVDTSLKKTT